jgi:hypothetical protein
MLTDGVSVGIFNEWNVLLYVARHRDTDEEAMNAAKRRGINLCGVIVVKRTDAEGKVTTRRYSVSEGAGGKLSLTPLGDPI